MKFLAIMAATPEGRVAKYMDFATKVEAETHVERFLGAWPDAFTLRKPAFPRAHWLVDMRAKTVTSDPPAPRPEIPEPKETRAIRALAARLDPAAVAEINSILN